MRFLKFGRSEPASEPLGADEERFARGTRTLRDLIAPASVEVARDHIRLDYQYARTLVVTGYPRTVTPGWLAPLIEFEAPIEISLHIHPLETGQMVRSLTHKLVQLHSSRLLAARDGKLADPEREVAYEDAERLRDALQRGEERIFSVSFYILLRAHSIAALDDLTRRVGSTLDSMLAQSRVAMLEQDSGFRSCLPEGTDGLLVYRNLDTSSLATTFPFSAPSISMDRGVLLGVANHSPVIFDLFDTSLENANMVVVARSGAGKSYFTKLMAMRMVVAAGIDFLVIDPEDEYRRLIPVLDGQYIRLASSSGQHMNPFDLPPADAADEDGRDPLAEQVASLLSLLEVMLAEPGRPLSAYERAVIDRALYQTYSEAGINAESATHSRPVPLMRNLAAVLAKQPGDLAASLAVRLRRYVEGSLAGLFSGPTNVSLQKQLVVFNIQALETELRPLGTHLITSFVWNQVRRRRRPRVLVVDEAWSLMQYAEGASFLSSLARRARKYYLGLITITQDAADFLNSEHGRVVLTNASTKLLLKQDSSTIEPVVAAFQLSAEERQQLLAAAKGEGLFFAKGTQFTLKIEASPEEHRLATTAPQELLARANAEVSPRVHEQAAERVGV